MLYFFEVWCDQDYLVNMNMKVALQSHMLAFVQKQSWPTVHALLFFPTLTETTKYLSYSIQ